MCFTWFGLAFPKCIWTVIKLPTLLREETCFRQVWEKSQLMSLVSRGIDLRDHETSPVMPLAQPMKCIEKCLKSLFIRYVSDSLQVNSDLMFRVQVRSDDLDTVPLL